MIATKLLLRTYDCALRLMGVMFIIYLVHEIGVRHWRVDEVVHVDANWFCEITDYRFPFEHEFIYGNDIRLHDHVSGRVIVLATGAGVGKAALKVEQPHKVQIFLPTGAAVYRTGIGELPVEVEFVTIPPTGIEYDKRLQAWKEAPFDDENRRWYCARVFPSLEKSRAASLNSSMGDRVGRPVYCDP